MLSRDRKHVSVQNPINHIRARRVSEGALIVVEVLEIVPSAFVKKLIEAYSSWECASNGLELLDEGVRMVGNFEHNAHYSESVVVAFLLFRSINKFMNNVEL